MEALDDLNFIFSKNRMALECSERHVRNTKLSSFTQSAKKLLKVIFTNLLVDPKSLDDLCYTLEKAYDVDQNQHFEEITKEEFDRLVLYYKSNYLQIIQGIMIFNKASSKHLSHTQTIMGL